MRAYWVLLLFLLNSNDSTAQTFTRWAEVVQWDGVSHWSKYMLTMPAYQGPNSLPVPRLSNGSADSVFSIAATAQAHFSPGDHTQNMHIYASYCLVKDRISFDVDWVPYERYRMSTAIKEERHVFSQFYYDQEAMGEFHLNTRIQVLNKWRPHLQLALRIGYRFPSGSGFGAARYTDGPGYYFDISAAKPIGKSGLKWLAMAGFYTWQIESAEHNQDDAFLFGTGLEWQRRSWKLQANLAGYLGYLAHNGDKPIVCRLEAEKKTGRFSILAGLQKGLHDFRFTSAELGTRYRIQ